MYQNMDVEILTRMKSGCKTLTTIKDILVTNLGKTQRTSLYNSNILLVNNFEERRTETCYDTENNGKIRAGNIAAVGTSEVR